MSRFLLLALALMPAASSAADWIEISSSKNVIAYIDRDSIRPRKDKFEAWTLWNFASPQSYPLGGSFLSRKTLFIFDCPNGTFADAQAVFYSEPDGDGQAMNPPPPRPVFKYPVPETVGESIYDEVCSRYPGTGV